MAHHRGRRLLDRHDHERQVRLLRQRRHGVSHPGFRVGVDGSLTILDEDGKTGEALVGVTDLAVSRDSQYLYGGLGGNGTGGIWAIAADGSLTDLGPVPGLPGGTAGNRRNLR
jgi:hypothetical protein